MAHVYVHVDVHVDVKAVDAGKRKTKIFCRFFQLIYKGIDQVLIQTYPTYQSRHQTGSNNGEVPTETSRKTIRAYAPQRMTM